MKSKTLLTCFLVSLFISAVINDKIERRRYRKFHKSHRQPAAPHPTVNIHTFLYRFYYGIVTRLLGQGQTKLEQCLPADWLNAKLSKDDENNVMSSLTALQSVLNKVSIRLTTKLNQACKNKARLVKYVLDKINFQLKKRRRRMMFQRHTIKPPNSKTTLRTFDPIISVFKDVSNAITGFMDLPLMKQAQSIFNCLAEKYPHVKQIKDIAQALAEKFPKLAKNDKTTVEVLVQTICNHHKFRRSIHFLNAAFKQSNDLTRWQGFGYFAGRFASALGTS